MPKNNVAEISHASQAINQITNFIRTTFSAAHKTRAVLAVSGGIDSAVVLALTVRAHGTENVTAVLLPHHNQPMQDAETAVRHVGLPAANIIRINIQPMVEMMAQTLGVVTDAAGTKPMPTDRDTLLRWGNLKARARMICVFDIAKKIDALVCGTENKSEHYLGYFTRFGDAASDLEPISTLYKTQVREVARELHLPDVFLTKAPSAGLWIGQTDEDEMGFSYSQADQVLAQYIDEGKAEGDVKIDGIPAETIHKIIAQVEQMKFKLEVPYELV